MTQFIDLELIKALIVLSLTLAIMISSFAAKNKKKEKRWQNSKKSNAKYYWLVYMLFIVAVIFFQTDNSMTQAKENIKEFRGVKVLRCTNTQERDNIKYRVSKKDGWEVDGFYFIKDSLMIRADKCEE